MKTVKDQATPRPWKLGYKDKSGMEIITNGKEAIAKTTWGCGCCESDPNENDLANLRLIVKAVNRDHLFDELVNVLILIKSELPELWGDKIIKGNGEFILSGETLDKLEEVHSKLKEVSND